MIEQQIKNIQRQLQIIDNQLIELVMTRQSLDELSNVKIDSETLVPVANGIFLKANIKEKDDFIVNVGSNVAVKKSKEDVRNMLEKQLDEIKNIQHDLLVNLQNLGMEGQRIEKELQNV